MALYNKQNADAAFYSGGNKLSVKLAVEEAVEIYGEASLAGWYEFAHCETSKLFEEIETEELRVESDSVIRRFEKKSDAAIDATIVQTDIATIKLLRMLRKTPHLYRAFAPTTGDDGQLFGFRNAFVISPIDLTLAAGQNRKLTVQVRGSKTTDGKPALEIEEVDMLVETAWPSSVTDFKTT
jgi:hypothetical protein